MPRPVSTLTTAERWEGIPESYWPKARYRVAHGWDRHDDYPTIGAAYARGRDLLATSVPDAAYALVEVLDTATEPMAVLLSGHRKVKPRR